MKNSPQRCQTSQQLLVRPLSSSPRLNVFIIRPSGQKIFWCHKWPFRLTGHTVTKATGYSTCHCCIVHNDLKWDYLLYHEYTVVNGLISHGPHRPLIMLPPNNYHPKWPSIVYVKVKCHFTEEIVDVWNSPSSFGDIILNILNFPPIKTTYSLSTYVHRPTQMH